MRLVIYATIAAVLVVPVFVAATPQTGEEAQKIDLSAVGGPILFIKCSNGHDLANCGVASLWEQTNAKTGLQTSITSDNGRPYDPDTNILP